MMQKNYSIGMYLGTRLCNFVHATYTSIRATAGLREAERCNILPSGHLGKVLCLLFVRSVEQDPLEPDGLQKTVDMHT